MSTEAEQVRARIDALLGELPDIAHHDLSSSDVDTDEVARRLEEAHDVLVQALESVEKG